MPHTDVIAARAAAAAAAAAAEGSSIHILRRVACSQPPCSNCKLPAQSLSSTSPRTSDYLRFTVITTSSAGAELRLVHVLIFCKL